MTSRTITLNIQIQTDLNVTKQNDENVEAEKPNEFSFKIKSFQKKVSTRYY